MHNAHMLPPSTILTRNFWSLEAWSLKIEMWSFKFESFSAKSTDWCLALEFETSQLNMKMSHLGFEISNTTLQLWNSNLKLQNQDSDHLWLDFEGGDNMKIASWYKPKFNLRFLDHFLFPNGIEIPFAGLNANCINVASWFKPTCFFSFARSHANPCRHKMAALRFKISFTFLQFNHQCRIPCVSIRI